MDYNFFRQLTNFKLLSQLLISRVNFRIKQTYYNKYPKNTPVDYFDIFGEVFLRITGDFQTQPCGNTTRQRVIVFAK